MAFIAAVVLSFVPTFFYAFVIYWLDRYEKEPLMLLGGAFFWGAIVATIGAIVTSMVLQTSILMITGSEMLTEVSGTTIIAPVVEETLKGLAVASIFLFFRHEFDSILDGIVYASITALGFAATENVLYLYFQGYVEGGGWSGLLALFVLRVLLGSYNHAVYTVFIGIGLALARLSHRGCVRFIAPLAGWILAIGVHAVHNIMAFFLGTQPSLNKLAAVLLVDWLGWLAMFATIMWAILREKRWITTYLHEEVSQGIITQKQFDTARSSWLQTFARLHALSKGRYGVTRRFYQLCAELAQKKQQFATYGDECETLARIETLRGQLAELSPLL